MAGGCGEPQGEGADPAEKPGFPRPSARAERPAVPWDPSCQHAWWNVHARVTLEVQEVGAS